MTITVNGEKKTFEEKSLTVSDLLTKENVEMPEMVSVELNSEFIERSDFDKIPVNDGDNIEFLYFMGGGESSKYSEKSLL